MLWQIFLFAAALSLDGAAAGLAYGLADIRMTLAARLLVAVAASGILAVSMLAGCLLQPFLDSSTSMLLSAVLLIGCGLFLLVGAKKPRNDKARCKSKEKPQEEMVWQISLPYLGFIIQILRNPAQADKNEDRCISLAEAGFLGLALSLDSLGAGIAVALGGFPLLLTVFVEFVTKFVFVTISFWLGRLMSHGRFQGGWKHSALLPPVIILLLGFYKMGEYLWWLLV